MLMKKSSTFAGGLLRLGLPAGIDNSGYSDQSGQTRQTRPRRAVQLLLYMLALVFFLSFAPGKAAAETPVSIDMKLLVISADGKEPVFGAIKSVLKQIGIPFDTLIATETATPLTARTLSDGNGAGRYQGILLTTGNLGYDAGSGNYQSALTGAQWAILWEYERAFRVRQVTLYTYPAGLPDTYGLNLVDAANTTSTPLQTSLTTSGKQLFSYLNGTNPITIRNAYTYLATPASSTNPVPLLSTTNNYAIASVFTYPDGRQNLAITADGNENLTHTLMLTYGVVNWVSKGFFLGQRKVYMSPQPDDLMIADDVWNIARLADDGLYSYRMSGNDYTRLIQWQDKLRAHSNTAQIRLEMPFNGAGVSGVYPNDTLTPAIRNNSAPFKWINHTYDHELLTSISYSNALSQLSKNHKVAQQFKFSLYSKDSMIQPEISGLDNPEFLRAAFDFGVRYILSDTSQPGWDTTNPNTGIYSTFQPSILIIPRHPTNLYYNVSTPEEWLSEYNHFYGPNGVIKPTWNPALNYTELLDKESEIWLRYLLKYDVKPVMLHQTNLRADEQGNSLAGDLINATVAKYNRLYNLPIRSPSQHDIGVLMKARMAYDASGVSGRIVLGRTNSILLRTVNATTLPLTGVSYGNNKESYGGQTISTISLGANGTLTIPGPAW